MKRGAWSIPKTWIRAVSILCVTLVLVTPLDVAAVSPPPARSDPPTLSPADLSPAAGPAAYFSSPAGTAEGAAARSRYGPYRTSPDAGIPRHAYSPFDKPETPAPSDRDKYVAGQVLVKFRGDAVATNSDSPAKVRSPVSSRLAGSHGIVSLEPVLRQAGTASARSRLNRLSGTPRGLERWFRARLAPGVTVPGAVQSLAKDSSVEAVEPEYLRPLAALPGPATDPRYGEQWHLAAIQAPQAWQFLSDNGTHPGGRREIIVAVIDTGVDYNHPDLAGNIWTNTGEIPGNGIDDDHNGFVDDVHGVNVVSNLKTGDPADDHGHGTHVAGIIAAQGNNGIGVVGVAYNVQIMPIKAAQYSGVLSTTDIAEAIYYAVEKGADVINMSFGGYTRSQLEEDALAVGFGQAVLVAAAGNDGKANELGPNIPGRPMYPAAYNWVLGVMASNQGGGLASFSNSDPFPRTSIEYELMAPGVHILSICTS